MVGSRLAMAWCPNCVGSLLVSGSNPTQAFPSDRAHVRARAHSSLDAAAPRSIETQRGRPRWATRHPGVDARPGPTMEACLLLASAAVSALALTAATAAPSPAPPTTPRPSSSGSPILFVDNQINPGVVAVAFRTDRPLDRKSNGRHRRARASGPQRLLSTFVKDQRPAYIAYVSGVSVARGGEHLKAATLQVTISLGHQEVAHGQATGQHQGVRGRAPARLLTQQATRARRCAGPSRLIRP